MARILEANLSLVYEEELFSKALLAKQSG